jgi:hypothetical protein
MLIAGLTACASNTQPAEASDSPTPGNNTNPGTGVSGTQEGDWAAIEKLEGEAKAIAKTAGCAAASECRAAPVGSRACGGPRYYIPYCAKSTDSAALFRKLDQVAKAEQDYNRKYNVVSTCEFRMAPALAIVGGSCAAQ